MYVFIANGPPVCVQVLSQTTGLLINLCLKLIMFVAALLFVLVVCTHLTPPHTCIIVRLTHV